MTSITVIYYSAFGHIAALSEAVAAGAERIEGVTCKRVRIPEFSDPSLQVARQRREEVPSELGQHFQLTKRIEDYEFVQKKQADIPVATMDDLREADGIVWGFPTYLGTMPGQVKSFLDQAGGFCTTGELEGKPTAVFTSAGSIHGGHEATILTSLVPLLHLGMIFVGLPYTKNPEYLTDQAIGGSPYGASTLAGPDGSRQPCEGEQTMAARMGERVAAIAHSLKQSHRL
ncbi:NAD(P)H:quinone oxidoreductase [Domibacillus robiginosus]|uniref:NAD(P)H:quinone oxidoreductase n=1 Tax=Domibacillus robiginosus TaxID=1071054 RepID=UPI00067D3D5C|nr:NAD(P)H:quinone oxidoreductase [Domibacillus robiginosus]